jgi:hypothetical protein
MASLLVIAVGSASVAMAAGTPNRAISSKTINARNFISLSFVKTDGLDKTNTTV